MPVMDTRCRRARHFYWGWLIQTVLGDDTEGSGKGGDGWGQRASVLLPGGLCLAV